MNSTTNHTSYNIMNPSTTPINPTHGNGKKYITLFIITGILITIAILTLESSYLKETNTNPSTSNQQEQPEDKTISPPIIPESTSDNGNIIIRYDDGTTETKVTLDYYDDQAIKQFYISQEKYNMTKYGKLYIYGKANKTKINNNTHRIQINTQYNIWINPYNYYNQTFTWAYFEIPKTRLKPGNNKISIYKYYNPTTGYENP